MTKEVRTAVLFVVPSVIYVLHNNIQFPAGPLPPAGPALCARALGRAGLRRRPTQRWRRSPQDLARPEKPDRPFRSSRQSHVQSRSGERRRLTAAAGRTGTLPAQALARPEGVPPALVRDSSGSR